jgi:hypothetical protein
MPCIHAIFLAYDIESNVAQSFTKFLYMRVGVGGIIEKTYYEGEGGGNNPHQYYVFCIIPPTPTLALIYGCGGGGE